MELETKDLRNKVEIYFKFFSSKDLTSLSGLFSEDVTLQDWDIFAEGKKEVVRANKIIFDSVDSINVILRELYQQDRVAVCLIEIEINQAEIIKVIDVIKFNKSFEIKEVSAYKQ